MKKNLTFKIGLFCAALVLVATCFVTSAWAKYTQTVSAVDEARVAKFEVGTSFDGTSITTENQSIDIFKTNYANVKYDNDEDGDSKDVIAPGSKGQFTITLSNDSEVAVSYELSAECVNANNIPLYFKVAGNWYTWATLSDGLEALDKKIAVDGADVNIDIEWVWFYDEFHAESLGFGSYANNDANDTILGKDGTYTFKVTITCVATQDMVA